MAACRHLLPLGAMLAAAGFLLLVTALPRTRAAGLSAGSLATLGEAAGLIREQALVAPKSERAMVQDMLRAYCHFFDPYGDYLTRREMRAFMESGSSDYFGVEMEIARRQGRLLLFPFPGGMAERRGIRAGDELIAVDGAPVGEQSVFVIGSTIRGKADTMVHLTVRRRGGVPRIFSLRREAAHYSPVHGRSFARADYVRISRFTRDTAGELQALLRQTGDHVTPLLIDLRRNQGGNLRAARRCADFFLVPGRAMLQMRTRSRARVISSRLPRETGRRVILLQDRVTASAAEVFIAALVENGRAVSVGETSFGKGLAQRFFPMADGAALRLTFAELLTPGGNRFNGKGLPPRYILETPSPAPATAMPDEQFIDRILDITKILPHR
ncbi:S41 family peptidase [Thermodesulfobacteriota bacterium B35]